MIDLVISWKSVLEILLLWFIIYHILLFFEGTPALQVLRGVVILIVGFLLIQVFSLDVLDWLLIKLFGISVIAVLIIFQPEIRQGLARIGQRKLFAQTLRDAELDSLIREIAKATENLSRDKLGALIAIQKNDSLTSYIETGVNLDAKVSADLIQAVFTPNNPLHDGALVIQGDRILAAGCLFPLSAKQDLNRIFGTRHRAALGLSEETDAIIIIVSEERNDVSLVSQNKLYKDLSHEELVSKIKELIKVN